MRITFVRLATTALIIGIVAWATGDKSWLVFGAVFFALWQSFAGEEPQP